MSEATEIYWVCLNCVIGDVESLPVVNPYVRRCCICGHWFKPKHIIAVDRYVFQNAVMRINDAGGRR